MHRELVVHADRRRGTCSISPSFGDRAPGGTAGARPATYPVPQNARQTAPCVWSSLGIAAAQPGDGGRPPSAPAKRDTTAEARCACRGPCRRCAPARMTAHTAAQEVLYPVYVLTCVLIRSVLKIGTRCLMLARSERLALRLSARGAVTGAAQEPGWCLAAPAGWRRRVEVATGDSRPGQMAQYSWIRQSRRAGSWLLLAGGVAARFARSAAADPLRRLKPAR